ncbi:MAG: exodeoxyribonuclease VII large subunit [Candidatus Nitrotoga sp.]
MIFGAKYGEKSPALSVRELNQIAKQLLENELPLLWVNGEISNFMRAASGHWYFALKDAHAQVRCVMFKHKNQYLEVVPKNGMQVEVLALPTLYEARGEFQLTLEQIRPAGLGILYEAFARLKTRLEAEGLFDAKHKRPLPVLPEKIGIITSPQAAALRDVLTTLNQRMPGIPVVLYPTAVQGADAAQKIAQAIQIANKRAECDVLLLCRGGGSLEDLWSFNEEVVARAIAHSTIPIVSGVGHEADFTIADFVADYRAATPTAAAQIATPERQQLLQRLRHAHAQLMKSKQRHTEGLMQQLDYLQRRLVHPAHRARQQGQHLNALQLQMRTLHTHTMQHRQWQWRSLLQRWQSNVPDVQWAGIQLEKLVQRLPAVMHSVLQDRDKQLDNLLANLQHLSPQRVLARGYSVVRDEQGNIVADSGQVSRGAQLDITFAHGWARAEVKDKSG